MIDVDEALRIVLEHAAPLAGETVPLVDALGRALLEEVRADRDLPPFTRSAMDGFAVLSADVAGAPVELPIAFEVAAGADPGAVLPSGLAARILTGAPLPEGADAVVMVERTEAIDDDRVRILQPAAARQNVIDRASDAASGDVVIETGTVVTPGAVGVAASVGRARVAVPRRPRAAFLSTGDEIVPVEDDPAPGQIRNSNANVAAAQLALAGAVLETSRIVPDTLEGTRAEIAAVLDHDLVILSGGVSVGRYDFVAPALREEGVEIRFHKVALKPGKPVLFGTRGKTLVFGLPGNPVSSLVTFLLFVAPAIRRMLGDPDPAPRRGRARLAAGPLRRRDRAQFLPAALSRDADGRLSVEPIGWHGSGHLAAMVSATGLLVVPVGEGEIAVGAEVEVVVDDRQLGAAG